MLVRRTIGCLLLFLVAFAAPVFAPTASAASKRTVTATIECIRVADSDSRLPQINVTIENHSGLPLTIAYLQSFGAGPNMDHGLSGLRLEDPKVGSTYEIADGDKETFEPVWAGVDIHRSDVIVALVVTSAGILLPSCDKDGTQTLTLDEQVPGNDDDLAEESAGIAATTIGQLESWRAYPALYALLYPDAQAAISFNQIACWYAERFGPPVNDGVNSIFSTTVDKVDWASWEWKVSGEKFEQSAVVSYSQAIGVTAVSTEQAAGVMHLVQIDGIWRWFFGSSAEGIKSLPSDCGLPATN
jgi:hypothetical protein